MGLLNYTTSISAEKTVSEIQSALAKAGARAVLHEYDGFGHVAAISFRIQTQFGEIAFRLPANIEAVQRILKKQALTGKIPRRYADDIDQATRTANGTADSQRLADRAARTDRDRHGDG